MTRFASRSSGFVLFAPCDPLALSSSRPWRDEYIRSHAEVPRHGAQGRTTPCLRVRARSRAHSSALHTRVCVYSCIHMRTRARNRVHLVHIIHGNAGVHVRVSSGMYYRILRQRMRNEVQASSSHQAACDRGCEERVFTLVMYMASSTGGDETLHSHLGDF